MPVRTLRLILTTAVVCVTAEYLAAWGKATYTAMAQADSEAVWVLDGWFANANGEPWFWCGANKTHAQHYLSQGNDPITTTKRSQKLQRGKHFSTQRLTNQADEALCGSARGWHPDPGPGGGLDGALA